MLVYAYWHKATNKIYIGKTTFSLRKRHLEHLAMARHGDDSYFHRALRKHGENAFHLSPISYAQTEEELNEMEKYFILRHRATESGIGYNLTFGGDGNLPTQAVRDLLSKKRKGRPSPMKGKRWPEASRKQKSAAMKGHAPTFTGKHSKETKSRIGAKSRENWKIRKTRVS
jgi:group I intron endonuclease